MHKFRAIVFKGLGSITWVWAIALILAMGAMGQSQLCLDEHGHVAVEIAKSDCQAAIPNTAIARAVDEICGSACSDYAFDLLGSLTLRSAVDQLYLLCLWTSIALVLFTLWGSWKSPVGHLARSYSRSLGLFSAHARMGQNLRSVRSVQLLC